MGGSDQCHWASRQSGALWRHLRYQDIAFEFGMWISAEFKIYLIKEFQRLKETEREQLGWDIRRNLTKINYRIRRCQCGATGVPSQPGNAERTFHPPRAIADGAAHPVEPHRDRANEAAAGRRGRSAAARQEAMNEQVSFTLRGRNPDVLTCIANLSNDEVFTPPELADRMWACWPRRRLQITMVQMCGPTRPCGFSTRSPSQAFFCARSPAGYGKLTTRPGGVAAAAHSVLSPQG